MKIQDIYYFIGAGIGLIIGSVSNKTGAALAGLFLLFVGLSLFFKWLKNRKVTK